MEHGAPHSPRCMIELTAGGQGNRCPGDACPFWENGCIFDRVEADLDGRWEVARLLLDVRRRLENAERQSKDEEMAVFHRRLSAGRE